MSRHILLFEDDADLKENMIEMLALNGFQLSAYSSLELTDNLAFTPNTIGICNESTILGSPKRFIKKLAQRAGDIILLCNDANQTGPTNHIHQLQLPFSDEDLISKINQIH